MNRLAVVVLMFCTAALSGCATTLPQHDAPPSYVRPVDLDSPLSRYVQDRQPDDTQLSGFRLLANGSDALASRLQMINMAEHSIDLQYYIYSSDLTGALLAERLLAAADRGVRVRILLDDIGNGLADFSVSALDHHPNIQLRLFNPLTFRHKWLRNLSKVAEFARINYRMHNKLMVADSSVFVTGGRNIGDEYYALSEMTFHDVDILGIGPITRDVSRSFDEFWNSRSAIPIKAVAGKSANGSLVQLRKSIRSVVGRVETRRYLDGVNESPYRQVLSDDSLAWYWGPAEWVYDPPEKADPTEPRKDVSHVAYELARRAEEAEDELLLMTAYLIPGAQGQAFLVDKVMADAALKVLTNSLSSTDLLAVHANYAPYRKPLLEAGAEMWELRPIAGQQGRASPFLSESLASLHAKTFVFDRRDLFVGSINLDPRSLWLNTESGVFVEQPELAAQAAKLFERWTSESYAFRLQLDEDGDIKWHADGHTWTSEPGASALRRISAWLLGWLPIESQL
ncbi:phospholipase D family protein [Pseudomonas profundi]|uniref:phospholipase D family protein n=1 Tax=Pseudomonas profundi TaxID=1981513 RepID=UPI0016818819|nr:phospholipase D family protein [Pseudomonas profundi]